MSQVMENRAEVTVVPRTEPVDSPGERWCSCRVEVLESVDVEGYPNLLGADLPREFDALIPTELRDAFALGAPPLRVTASLAGPGTLRVQPHAL